MKEFEVTKKYDNKRIDFVLISTFPQLSINTLYKSFRKKDIRVNGKRVPMDHLVNEGDNVEIYIVDDILYGLSNKNSDMIYGCFSIVYEDQNILLVNKKPGILVHSDINQSQNTLIELIEKYLKETDPQSTPALCHRLDRNTGGLILIAKNIASLNILLHKIKAKEITKLYQCLVKGKMEHPSKTLKAYLKKDPKNSKVYLSDAPQKGYSEIITKYSVISFKNDISKLEIELITGKTHQIRAHLSHISHPILGDGKYGVNSFNKLHGAKYQQLWAYKIIFNFKTDSGILNYLRNRSFEVPPEFN